MSAEVERKALMRAIADVVKSRIDHAERRVKTIDATMLVPEFTNQIAAPDFGPLTEAVERFAARELPTPQVSVQAPHVTVEAPNIELHPNYEFSPTMDAPVVNVNVDMTPVAKAIDRQTECLEKLIGKVLACIDKDKRPKDGKIKREKDGQYTFHVE